MEEEKRMKKGYTMPEIEVIEFETEVMVDGLISIGGSTGEDTGKYDKAVPAPDPNDD